MSCSARLRAAGLALLTGTLVAYVLLIHDFLAVTQPVGAQVLIVEGWFPNQPAIKQAAALITSGKYRLALCVGGPASAPSAAADRSDAERTANRLVSLGVKRASVHVVLVNEPEGWRTFGAGRAVGAWLAKERPDVRAVDVFTLGVHARKSRLLFQKALGSGFSVGVIAGTDADVAPRRWWWSSRGWYLTLRNTAGYLYALAFPA